MIATILEWSWPDQRLGEALEALGRAAGFSKASQAVELPSPPPAASDGEALGRWIGSAAACLSLDAEPVAIPHSDVARFLQDAGPAMVRVTDDGVSRFVAILRGGRRAVTVLDRDGRPRRFDTDTLATLLRRPLELGVKPNFQAMVDRAVPAPRRARVRDALLREHLARGLVTDCWLVRCPSSAPIGLQARQAGLPRLLQWVFATHAAAYALTLVSWWAISKGALQGRFDNGWIAAWLLALVTLVPLRLMGARHLSQFSISAGVLLKTRLLAGTLRLDPSTVRHEGSGQLLGRVLESSAVESLGLSGGLMALAAVIEVAFCFVLLAQGAGGWLHAALLLVVVAVASLMGWRHYNRRRSWTDVRLSMTHDLVERMVGHRTRLAQEPRARWHDGEDHALARYLDTSRELDRTSLALAAIPRAWVFLGVLALLPSLMSGTPSTTELALALGGVLLGAGALATLTGGASRIAGALVGWSRARPLALAAESVEAAPSPNLAALGGASPDAGSLLVHAQDLVFRYRNGGEPVLRGCSLRVSAGDRILLEGRSGGGKSTLGAVITGLRVPESGVLLLGGLDRYALGATGWRRRVTAVSVRGWKPS